MNEVRSLYEQLIPLKKKISSVAGIEEKLEILNDLDLVQREVESSPSLKTFLAGLTPDCDLAIKSVLAIGQGKRVFTIPEEQSDRFERLRQVLMQLIEVERFYASIGGVIGYHLAVLEQILASEKEKNRANATFVHPKGIDISKDSECVAKYTLGGLKDLGKMAEIYPVGGAGDRLNLCDEETGEPLPVARLPFNGRSLLEGLIRDLEGKEYLHYCLYGEKVCTPIVMMTSPVKDNDRQIQELCEEMQWFGRGKENFFFCRQPLVPVVSVEGDWVLSNPLELVMKPGGHGVLWMVAKESGAFAWLEEKQRSKFIVRQINNPIGGTDRGLLAFAGVGLEGDKAFGFASCPRVVNSAEGVNIVIQEQVDQGYKICLTNIEYTDFAKNGIEDAPESKGSHFSAYPSNTNLLFGDIQAVQKLVEKKPLPGLLINMKNKAKIRDESGQVRDVPAGRLETTMQNLADALKDSFPVPYSELKGFPTQAYLTRNERDKTMASTKKAYIAGGPLLETPEGCFYVQQKNMHELFVKHCKAKMPTLQTENEYLSQGPSTIIDIHPALGPLYAVISQKIQGASIQKGSELKLEIAELDCKNLALNGSLLIKVDDLKRGKCVLENVTVTNKGADLSDVTKTWKDQMSRKESLHIKIHGNGEFVAKNVAFSGATTIEVPNGVRVLASEKDGVITYEDEELCHPKGYWIYSIREDKEIILKPQSKECTAKP
jgi:hypothetical protein